MKNETIMPSGSCFWGHKWTKWEILDAKKTSVRKAERFTFKVDVQVQKRSCVKCNKVEIKEIK